AARWRLQVAVEVVDRQDPQLNGRTVLRAGGRRKQHEQRDDNEAERSHDDRQGARTHPALRARKPLKALSASSDCMRSPKCLPSSAKRSAITSCDNRNSRREIATASAGSAQISRATLRASVSTCPGATTSLTKPASRAASPSSARPITSIANAR